MERRRWLPLLMLRRSLLILRRLLEYLSLWWCNNVLLRCRRKIRHDGWVLPDITLRKLWLRWSHSDWRLVICFRRWNLVERDMLLFIIAKVMHKHRIMYSMLLLLCRLPVLVLLLVWILLLGKLLLLVLSILLDWLSISRLSKLLLLLLLQLLLLLLPLQQLLLLLLLLLEHLLLLSDLDYRVVDS